MTRSGGLWWKLLFGLFVVSALGCFLAWAFLLTSVCAHPGTHAFDAEHHIAYSCHGKTLYLSGFEQALHVWLVPVGMLFTMLSVLTGLVVVLNMAKVRVKMRVRVQRTEAAGKHSGHGP